MRIQTTAIITLLATIMTIGPIAPAHARNEGLIMLGTTAVVGGVAGYLALSGNPRVKQALASTGEQIAAATVTQGIIGAVSSHHSNNAPSYYANPSTAYIPQYYVAVPRGAYQRYGN